MLAKGAARSPQPETTREGATRSKSAIGDERPSVEPNPLPVPLSIAPLAETGPIDDFSPILEPGSWLPVRL